MSLAPCPALSLLPLTAQDLARAQTLAQQLSAPLLEPGSDPKRLDEGLLLLLVGADGLQACESGRQAPGPVRVDFTGGAVAHRRQFGGGSGQQIAKAIGIKPGVRPRVADLTAGLGRDAFVLASLGCALTLLERSPVVGLLLADGLQRAALDPEVGPIVARMTLHAGAAQEWLARQQQLAAAERPEVIYLDPMFPHSKKSAQVKKEMRLFRDLVGADADADQLLPLALAVATARVVVKRPRKAPFLADRNPSYSLEGKSGRFDIYTLKALRREE